MIVVDELVLSQQDPPHINRSILVSLESFIRWFWISNRWNLT